MTSRNPAAKQVGRMKSSDIVMSVDGEGMVDPDDRLAAYPKIVKKKKKKSQDEEEYQEARTHRLHDARQEPKRLDAMAETSDKKDSFMEQAGTSSASPSRKVVTDIWVNPKEAVNWNLDSLVTLNVLGRGSFGIVYLVRHRVNRQLAALKYIRKKNQNPEKERKRVEVEKAVWEAVTDHPCVVTLRAYFETAKGWCFVMEYLPEGSIRDLVRKKGPFKEETARLLSAQLALAIQHVHEKGFLHRDISSSNVLIDSRGNAKLIDFGLSQIGTEAWSRCGSLAYMAPEVIRQELYGTSADWWSFGIVLFVMLVGKTPLAIYAAEKGVDLHLARKDIRYRLALIAPLNIPRTLSRSAQTLLKDILKENPKRRLGCRPEGGFDDIMKSPFYAAIDWSDVSCGSLPSTTREEGSNVST
ncbi:protein kinase C iota type-like isoform X2 [Ornithodoros turicata]|uniref:protein kinase C iota type-like isoform X2 n=1 Tax=Ornithodoros turicata TaxID=34597 RepID=UPI0031387995